MHGYLVTYTEEKLRHYREADGELRKLWDGERTASAASRTLGFAASRWWTALLGKRGNVIRRRGTSMK